ncbi:hypothetical protein, partial [Nocardia brevicatena]|uniref:hypothetical protein n=1 Tax=Nocardia brevicatena TaxID=37327 RepID=UPI0012FBA42F
MDFSSPADIAEAFYNPLPKDAVTEFYDGRLSGFKLGELHRAQQHVADTGEPAFWLSGDIANLGGLNAASGNRAEVANTHYRAMTDIFLSEVEKSGARVVPIRTGGDEVGAVVIGVDEQAVTAAIARTENRIAEYARTNGLSEIEHPKHPGDPAYRGVGLHLGHAEIVPGMDIRNTLDAADLGIDLS